MTWRGTLHRDGDGIRGTLTDAFGMVTEITGTRGVNGYDITARLLSVPAAYELPGDPTEAPAKPAKEPKPERKTRPPKPGDGNMIGGDICPHCWSVHPAPTCGWDIHAPCPSCGRPIGGKTKRMTGEVCAACERARGGAV